MTISISVIIPSYNYGRFIAAAIDSVFAQTLPPHEIIVVDDGSSDDTLAVLGHFGTRVRIVRQQNAGVGAARNRGVSASTGTHVAFLDADDEWEPTKLEKQAACVSSTPGLGFVHCGMVEIDVDGTPLRTAVDGLSGDIASALLLFERAAVVAPGGTLLVPREVFDEVGGFDIRCPPSEDWDLSFSIARRYPVAFVPEPLLRYRQHGRGGHLNIARMERGMLIAFEKAFAMSDPVLYPLRRRAYGNLHRVLAGSYFQAGQYVAFVKQAALALAWTPESAKHFLGYPKRLWLRKIASAMGSR